MPGRENAAPAVLLLAALLWPSPTRASGEAARDAYRAGQGASAKDSRGHYKKGVEQARRALATNPDDPSALLWYAANLAGEALTYGKVFALRVIPEVERTLLRLEERHPTYDHAAAARVLGRLYHKAPPVISIGSNAKAEMFLGKALERAPEFPGNQAFAADLYNARGDCGRARPLAVLLQAARDLERHGPDAKEWRTIAADVLDDCPPAKAR